MTAQQILARNIIRNIPPEDLPALPVVETDHLPTPSLERVREHDGGRGRAREPDRPAYPRVVHVPRRTRIGRAHAT